MTYIKDFFTYSTEFSTIMDYFPAGIIAFFNFNGTLLKICGQVVKNPIYSKILIKK